MSLHAPRCVAAWLAHVGTSSGWSVSARRLTFWTAVAVAAVLPIVRPSRHRSKLPSSASWTQD